MIEWHGVCLSRGERTKERTKEHVTMVQCAMGMVKCAQVQLIVYIG